MRPMRCRFIAFFTLALYFTGFALTGIVTGSVTGVLDGDTIEVLHQGRPNVSASAGSIARRRAKPW
jgi:hypothetical protein